MFRGPFLSSWHRHFSQNRDGFRVKNYPNPLIFCPKSKYLVKKLQNKIIYYLSFKTFLFYYKVFLVLTINS